MALLAIVGKDLRQRLRDRSFFVIGVLAPFGLALIFSFLLGGVTGGTFRPAIGLADLDASPTSEAFAAVLGDLDREEVIAVTGGLTEEEARRQVEEGELDAAYLIPDGLHSAILSGSPAEIELVADVDAATSTEIARAIASAFLERVRATQVSVAAVAVVSGEPPDPALAEAASSFDPPISIGEVETATRELDPDTYYTAAMAIFFVFFTVSIGVTSLLDERREGTMARLLAAPIRRSSILAAKGLTSVVLGVFSMAVLALASTLLIGADWGDPVGAALLILAGVLAAAGIMAFVAGIANTPESAGNMQAIVAVTLGALGGSFFSVSLSEGVLSRIALITPHHWFLRGLADLAGGGGVGEVLPSVAAILAFALVTGLIGSVLLRRKVLA